MPTITGVSGSSSVASTTTPDATSANGLTNQRFAADATFESIAAGTATMAKGAKGDAVRKLQAALLDMGFSLRPYTLNGKTVGGIDGGYGNQTTNALQNFQRHAKNFFSGVQVSGSLDQATLRALDALAPPPGMKATAPGQSPKVPTPMWEGQTPLRVVVVKNEHRTFLFDETCTKIQGIYSNAVGAQATQTHVGLKVISAVRDQAWAEMAGANSKWKDKKSFGHRYIDLSWHPGNRHSGEELHGTYAYAQMGMDVSHGCVRHYNEDIVDIASKVKVGDKVVIVDSLSDPHLRTA